MSHALATVLHRGRRPRVASREAQSQKTAPKKVPSLTILEANSFHPILGLGPKRRQRGLSTEAQ